MSGKHRTTSSFSLINWQINQKPHQLATNLFQFHYPSVHKTSPLVVYFYSYTNCLLLDMSKSTQTYQRTSFLSWLVTLVSLLISYGGSWFVKLTKIKRGLFPFPWWQPPEINIRHSSKQLCIGLFHSSQEVILGWGRLRFNCNFFCPSQHRSSNPGLVKAQCTTFGKKIRFFQIVV